MNTCESCCAEAIDGKWACQDMLINGRTTTPYKFCKFVSGPIGSGARGAPNPGGPRVPGVSSSPEGLSKNLGICVRHQFVAACCRTISKTIIYIDSIAQVVA